MEDWEWKYKRLDAEGPVKTLLKDRAENGIERLIQEIFRG